MPQNNTVFDQMQDDAVALLERDPFFADIPVLPLQKGVTLNKINRHMGVAKGKASKVGAVVIVGLPAYRNLHENPPTPIGRSQGAIEILEKPVLNRGATGTGKKAGEIARRVARLLHHYLPAGLTDIWTVSGINGIGTSPDGMVAFSVTWEFGDVIDGDVKLAMPTIVGADVGGGNFDITITAEAGASIYYSTDGTLPTSNAGTLYAGTFTLAVPFTVRAAAEKAGQEASNCELYEVLAA